MKTLSLILLSFLLSKGCSSQSQTDLKDTLLEYTANTRGFYIKIVIQNQMVMVYKDRDGNDKPVAKKINDTNWKTLVAEFQKINLDKLSDYIGPTEKRFYDGAAMGNLNITFKGKLYESQTFDHGNPPSEIEKLVETVLLTTKKE